MPDSPVTWAALPHNSPIYSNGPAQHTYRQVMSGATIQLAHISVFDNACQKADTAAITAAAAATTAAAAAG